MSPRGVPDIAPADLRDPPDPVRVDRVWRRLRRNLSPIDRAPPPGRRRDIALVAGASVAALAAGLLLGKAIWAPRAHADFWSAELPGIRPDTFAQGAPPMTASGREPTVAPPPALPPPSASPSPLVTSPSAPAPPPPGLSGQPASPVPTALPTTSARAPAASAWRVRHAEGDLAGALEILRRAPGGADAAIASAATAQELMDLSDVFRLRNGDRDAALRALTRVVDRFPGNVYAPIAAYTVGKMLAERGNHEEAARHFDRARSLGLRIDVPHDTQ